MINISLIGRGRLASSLKANILNNNHLRLVGQCVRAVSSQDESFVVNDIRLLPPADICIICVPDTSIEEVSKKIRVEGQLVVHTSGATPMGAIKHSRRGVLYPVQAFQKNSIRDLKSVPIAIEASDEESLHRLRETAESLSEHVVFLNSQQRLHLHLAAVWSNNFVNCLYGVAESICKAENIPFSLLYPIIKTASESLLTSSPKDLQAGPAVRGDRQTIDRHLALLNSPQQKELYRLLTNLIQEHSSLSK